MIKYFARFKFCLCFFVVASLIAHLFQHFMWGLTQDRIEIAFISFSVFFSVMLFHEFWVSKKLSLDTKDVQEAMVRIDERQDGIRKHIAEIERKIIDD